MTGFMLARATAALPRRLFSSKKLLSTLVPLEDEFPGLPSLKPEPAKATSGSVSTLSNGLIVVTENACSTSTVTMTYPKAGSASEAIEENGAALINKCLSFRSGSGISTLMINRTIENHGGTPFAKLDRSKATLGYTVSPENATELLPFLATQCSFERWDMRDAKKLAATEAEVAYESAQVVLTENIFAAAYGPQNPAGRSLFFSDASLDQVKAFRERGYGVKGAILTATGVKDHAAFCKEAEELLSGTPSGGSSEQSTMKYIGGESRVFAPSAGFAHVALAFEAPSSSVLTGIVKQAFNIAGLEAGITGFSSQGVLGVYGGSESGAGICDAMTQVVKTSLTADIVKRAKSLAKAEALLAMDTGSPTLADFMTASVIETGTFSGPAEVAKAYDAVSDAQVKDAVSKMLKSKPSLAAIGDISSVPYHATVASQF